MVTARYAPSVWRCPNLQSDAGGDLGEDVLDVGAEHGDREDDDKGNQSDHEGVFDSGRATVAAQRSNPDLHLDDAGEKDFGSLHMREMTRNENSDPPLNVASGGLAGHRPIGAESGAVRPGLEFDVKMRNICSKVPWTGLWLRLAAGARIGPLPPHGIMVFNGF